MDTEQLLARGPGRRVHVVVEIVCLPPDSFVHEGELLGGENVHADVREVIRMIDHWNAHFGSPLR